MKRLAEFTKFRRTEKGFSQIELADKIEGSGINNNYISRLENGSLESIRLPTLVNLLTALDSELDFKCIDKEDETEA